MKEVLGPVRPCLRQSGARMPTSGASERMYEAQVAKERPEAPAPWWRMKSGEEGEEGGV